MFTSYHWIAGGRRGLWGKRSKKGQNTHVCPHCVVTGLSKISRQTGQTNSDTSLLPSETFFLCWAALNPPSIAISFLHWLSPPPTVPVSTSPDCFFFMREGGVMAKVQPAITFKLLRDSSSKYLVLTFLYTVYAWLFKYTDRYTIKKQQILTFGKQGLVILTIVAIKTFVCL